MDDHLNGFRRPTPDEARLLRALAARAPDLRLPAGWLDRVRVQSMDDGGMGSVRISAGGGERTDRAFGREVARLEFVDEDGVPVSATLNVDDGGELFEADVWKADFSPVIRVPTDPSR